MPVAAKQQTQRLHQSHASAPNGAKHPTPPRTTHKRASIHSPPPPHHPRRDFPAEHLVPLNQAEGAAAPSGEGGSAHQRLNPWQERHAKLVCQVVKEVNELRYVSCPRCAALRWAA